MAGSTSPLVFMNFLKIQTKLKWISDLIWGDFETNCGMLADYGIFWFTKIYEVPVVLLAFQLLSGCLPLPFGIAKSSGVRNPFSAIKCKKEKVCINLCKVTD